MTTLFNVEHNFHCDKDIGLSSSLFKISWENFIYMKSTLDSVYLKVYLFILWCKVVAGFITLPGKVHKYSRSRDYESSIAYVSLGWGTGIFA